MMRAMWHHEVEEVRKPFPDLHDALLGLPDWDSLTRSQALQPLHN